MVSDPEVFSARPYLLNLMDIRAQKASRGGHLLEGVGKVMGSLMVIVQVMHFKICPPSQSDESFPRASQQLSLRSIARDLPSFCLWWGHSSGVMSNPSSFLFLFPVR